MNGSEPSVARRSWPRWLQQADAAASIVTALLLASLMLITVIDVVGRYAMNRPLSGAAEWIELSMGVMIFGGFFQAGVSGEHVRIDLLDKAWSRTARRVVDAIARIVSAVVLLGVAWRLLVKAQEMSGYADVSSYLGVPLAPLACVMAAASALTALVYLLELLVPVAAPRGSGMPQPDKMLDPRHT